MRNKIYGKQDVFAIEVQELDVQKQEGKIRFWLNGKEFGDLETIDQLSDAAGALNVLISKKNELYDNAFDHMSIQEIFTYCLFLGRTTDDFSPEDYILFKKMKLFSLFFGEQFDNVAHVIFCKDGLYHFLWSYNNDYSVTKTDYLKNLDHTTVSADELTRVSEIFFKDAGF